MAGCMDKFSTDETTSHLLGQGSTEKLVSPAAGLCTSANDHAAFFQMMVRNGTALDGTVVLSEESVDLMFSDRTGEADLSMMLSFLTWDKWAGSPCGTTMTRFNNPAFRAAAARPAGGSLSIDPELLEDDNKPILGYGLGSILVTGVKSPGMMHFDSAGFMWYIARGRYALSATPIRKDLTDKVSPTPLPMIYVLERDNFPEMPMCPGFKNLEKKFTQTQLIDPYAPMKALEL